MILPAARTEDEAQLYLDLHPCPDCGSVRTAWRSGPAVADGQLVSRFSGECGGCGASRRYDFARPGRITAPAGYPTFGAETPSSLIDAGEWLSVSELVAGSVPSEEPAGAQRALAIATAAVDEVLKFIPAGQDAVPDSAFWTDPGRQARDRSPGRFRRDRLVVIRDTYRDLAAQKAATHNRPRS